MPITYALLSKFISQNPDITKFNMVSTAAVKPDGTQDDVALAALYKACLPYHLKLYQEMIVASYQDPRRRNVYLHPTDSTRALVYVGLPTTGKPARSWEVHPIGDAIWVMYLAAKHGVDAAHLLPEYHSIHFCYTEALSCMQFYHDEQLTLTYGKSAILALLAAHPAPTAVTAIAMTSSLPAKPLVPKPKRSGAGFAIAPAKPNRRDNPEDVVANSPIGPISMDQVAAILKARRLLQTPGVAIHTIFNAIIADMRADRVSQPAAVREAAYYHLDKKLWEVCSNKLLEEEACELGLQLSKDYNENFCTNDFVSVAELAAPMPTAEPMCQQVEHKEEFNSPELVQPVVAPAAPQLFLANRVDARKMVVKAMVSTRSPTAASILTWQGLVRDVIRILDPAFYPPPVATKLHDLVSALLLEACGKELGPVQSNIVRCVAGAPMASPPALQMPKVPLKMPAVKQPTC
jgi:hypothetical protein